MDKKLVLYYLNAITKKARKIAADRKAQGLDTCLEDVLETIQLELENVKHNELIELATFCVGICVAMGPTKIRGAMATKQTPE